MEISKENYDRIGAAFKLFFQHETFELEAKIDKGCDKDAFIKMIQYCRSVMTPLLDRSVEYQDSLDISVHVDETPYRLTILGNEAIQEYCKNDVVQMSSIVVISKQRVPDFQPIRFEKLGFKVDLKGEVVVKQKTIQKIVESLKSLKKMFRLKKRFSYTLGGQLRFDCTIVKSPASSTQYNNMIESIRSLVDKYEVEIEVLRSEKDPADANTLIQAICDMYVLVNGDPQFDHIRDEYIKLCFEGKMNQETIDQNLRNRKNSLFFAPQPITLERKNILPPELGRITIFDDYTVTDKADGERALLFIDSKAHGYYINNILEVKDSLTKFPLKYANSLLDGEYISKGKQNIELNIYAIFDMYFDNKKVISLLPLMDNDKKTKTRYKHMVNFKESLDLPNIIIKDFLVATDDQTIFKQSRDLYNRKLYEVDYVIDGLIYTPMKLAVGANYLNENNPRHTDTWKNVFKWKPPHDNTVDFLVRFEPFDQVARLYVGQRPMDWEPLTLDKYFDDKLTRSSEYLEAAFLPNDIVDRETFSTYNLSNPSCKNGDIIENESIVEFSYDFEMGWMPLRVRRDKTMAFKKTSRLAKTANDYGTALNIWQSIKFPVTSDHIFGVTTLSPSEIDDMDQKYYSRNVSRDKMASENMMKYHNYIKTQLLKFGSNYKKNKLQLLDLACGRAGDLYKWNDFKLVVGFDYNRDNLENPSDNGGAYARVFKNFENSEHKNDRINYLILVMDCGQILDKEYIRSMQAPTFDKEVAQLMWNGSKIDNANLKQYSKIMQKGFDVVSCQFAIHYFFKDETTIDNFVHNVDSFLNDGGTFIGTCLDGFKVKKMLQGIDEKEADIKGRVLWNIQKHYEEDNPKAIKIGEKINVYMESINQRLDEFLVNIDTLTKKLKDKHILLHPKDGIRNFADYYADFEKYKSKDKLLSDKEKEYSFLNISFKYIKKVPKKGKAIDDETKIIDNNAKEQEEPTKKKIPMTLKNKQP